MNVKISNEISDNHPLNCAEIVCEEMKKKKAPKKRDHSIN
jgi:hypothetical protein